MPKNVELGVEKWSPDSKKIIGASVMKDSKLRRVTVLDVSTFGVEFLDIPKSDRLIFKLVTRQ